VTVAASNALQYPFLTAFNQARTRRLREDAEQRLRRQRGRAAAAAGAAPAAVPGLAGDPVVAAGDGDGRAAAPGGGEGQPSSLPGDGEPEYEFNQGEQLMLQVRPRKPLLRYGQISPDLEHDAHVHALSVVLRFLNFTSGRAHQEGCTHFWLAERGLRSPPLVV